MYIRVYTGTPVVFIQVYYYYYYYSTQTYRSVVIRPVPLSFIGVLWWFPVRNSTVGVRCDYFCCPTVTLFFTRFDFKYFQPLCASFQPNSKKEKIVNIRLHTCMNMYFVFYVHDFFVDEPILMIIFALGLVSLQSGPYSCHESIGQTTCPNNRPNLTFLFLELDFAITSFRTMFYCHVA